MLTIEIETNTTHHWWKQTSFYNLFMCVCVCVCWLPQADRCVYCSVRKMIGLLCVLCPSTSLNRPQVCTHLGDSSRWLSKNPTNLSRWPTKSPTSSHILSFSQPTTLTKKPSTCSTNPFHGFLHKALKLWIVWPLAISKSVWNWFKFLLGIFVPGFWFLPITHMFNKWFNCPFLKFLWLPFHHHLY
jgi:hypothetical protein